MSFRLAWLFHDAYRVRAAVFSSDTWDWHVLPWTEVAARMPPHDDEDDDNRTEWLQRGSQANNGLVHLPFRCLDLVLTLDAKTMEFSVWELPPPLCSTPRSLVVGETKDGTPCMVCAAGSSITVWMRRGGADENWEFEDVLFHSEEPELLGDVGTPDVMAVMDGFVYMATTESILSLCLKTWNLEKLFPCTYGGEIYPYFMAWPPSLVGNYGSFANCSAPTQDDDSCWLVLHSCVKAKKFQHRDTYGM
ncbi:hypothetical protein EJB05_54829, partial [Eragrostis curvula]